MNIRPRPRPLGQGGNYLGKTGETAEKACSGQSDGGKGKTGRGEGGQTRSGEKTGGQPEKSGVKSGGPAKQAENPEPKPADA